MLSAERVGELDALGMVWGGRDDGLQRGIVAARAYRAAHGHLKVPKRFVTDDGFRLGVWIGNRRAVRNAGRLPTERIMELDALDMVWDVLEEDWQRGLAVARAYRAAHGHLRVPARFVTEDGFRLGIWTSNRRADRRRDVLSVERVSELDALGMIWDARTTA